MDEPAAGRTIDPDASRVADLAEEVERLRAENDRLLERVDPVSEAARAAVRRRRRRVAAIVLLVAGCVALPISVLTVWVRNQVLDTERYVQTVAPLSDDPLVISALESRLNSRISEELDVASLAEEALPDDAAFLAAPIAAGADNLIGQATSRFLESDQFDRLWIEANRVAHDGLVVAVTGQEGDVVSTVDGKVVLQLGGLAEAVLEQLDERFGTDFAARVPTERLDAINIEIVDSAQLADVQAAVRMLDRLSWFSLLVALGLLAGSVAASPDRRSGVWRLGVGVAVSMLVLFGGFAVARELYLTNLPSVVERPDVAAAVFDTLTRLVLQAVRVIFAIGVVLVTAAWLTGPNRAATNVRSWWNRLLGRGGTLTGSAVDLGPVPAWFARHLTAVRGVVVALAVVVLLSWERPTGRVVLVIALVTLVPLALVQLLASAGRTGTGRGVDDEGAAHKSVAGEDPTATDTSATKDATDRNVVDQGV